MTVCWPKSSARTRRRDFLKKPDLNANASRVSFFRILDTSRISVERPGDERSLSGVAMLRVSLKQWESELTRDQRPYLDEPKKPRRRRRRRRLSCKSAHFTLKENFFLKRKKFIAVRPAATPPSSISSRLLLWIFSDLCAEFAMHDLSFSIGDLKSSGESCFRRAQSKFDALHYFPFAFIADRAIILRIINIKHDI